MLGVSPDTVRRRIASGSLAAFRDGRIIRVSVAEVERYIVERTPARASAPAPRARRAAQRLRHRVGSPVMTGGGDEYDMPALLARLRHLQAEQDGRG